MIYKESWVYITDSTDDFTSLTMSYLVRLELFPFSPFSTLGYLSLTSLLLLLLLLLFSTVNSVLSVFNHDKNTNYAIELVKKPLIQLEKIDHQSIHVYCITLPIIPLTRVKHQ